MLALIGQLEETSCGPAQFDQRIPKSRGSGEGRFSASTVPGVGPMTASAIVASSDQRQAVPKTATVGSSLTGSTTELDQVQAGSGTVDADHRSCRCA